MRNPSLRARRSNRPRAELLLVLVSVALLVGAVIAACVKTITPEFPATPGLLATATAGLPPATATPPPSPPAATLPPPAITFTLAPATPAPRSPSATAGENMASPTTRPDKGRPPGAVVTPKPPIMSDEEWRKIAFSYISEKYQVPIESLQGRASQQELPLTGILVIVGKVVKPGLPRGGPQGLRTWIIGIDRNRKIYEKDGIQALEAAERAARVAKYGKLDPVLHGILQPKAPQDTVWVYISVHGSRHPDDIWSEIRARFPEAQIDPAGRPTKDTPMDLYNKVIYPEYQRQKAITGAQATDSVADHLRGQGYAVTQVAGLPSMHAVLPKRVVLEVAQRPDVAGISLVPEVKDSADIATPSIGGPTNWERSRNITGSGIKLGMIEGGTPDSSNPYLGSRVESVSTPNPGFHATSVAGAGAGDHPRYKGPAHKSTILAHSTTWTPYQDATQNLINNGARVINHSWASAPKSTSFQTSDRFYDYVSRYDGVVNVVAAGNYGQDEVDSPGKGYNVITVGGIRDWDDIRWSGDTMFSTGNNSSSWKNPAEGNEKPELTAPGQNMMVTAHQDDPNDSDNNWIIDSPGYHGTSLAAPMVAGGTAMLFEQKSSLILSPEAVKAILVVSAIHNIEGDAALVMDPDGVNRDGAGAVNLAEAYNIAAGNQWEHAFINLSTSFDEDGWYISSKQISGVKNTERIRAAIAWNSAPNASYTEDELKTDLDLYLYRLDSQGYEVELVSTSWSWDNAVESLDYHRSTAASTTNYALWVYKYDSTETSNILGIAWWVGPRYYAASSLWQERNDGMTSSPILQRVQLDSFAEPRKPSKDGNEISLPGGTLAYSARATYPGWDASYGSYNANYSSRHPIWVKDIEPGNSPFTSFTQKSTNNDAHEAYTTYSASASVGASPSLPLVPARMGVMLDGDARKYYSFYLALDSLSDTGVSPAEAIAPQTASYFEFMRGDAKVDRQVTSADSMFIQQYLAGNRSLSDLNALNAASPRHDQDSSPYDGITVTDALFIGQMLAGLRDYFYEYIGESGSGYAAGGSGQATIEAGSLQLDGGKAGRIPITLKTISGMAGIGAYDIRVRYNPSVVRVDSIDGGAAPFDKSAVHRIDNTRGVLSMNDYHTRAQGLKDDAAIAYLNVSPLPGSAGKSSDIQLSVTTLSDTMGNNISVSVAGGTVLVK
ncbi:MAG: S8 family serine peptidase [Chloroflexi bacterium]|nr:S8 family serine peptidase [Chloroflexota bacterium]